MLPFIHCCKPCARMLEQRKCLQYDKVKSAAEAFIPDKSKDSATAEDKIKTKFDFYDSLQNGKKISDIVDKVSRLACFVAFSVS